MDLRIVNPDEFAKTAADIIQSTIQQPNAVNICFPTGDTPKSVYLELENRVRNKELSFQKVRGFGLDEWGELAPDDPIRCSSRIRQDLYRRVDIAEFYYADPQASDMSIECARYDELLQNKGGLDLAILGIGLNGHVGFNEPGSQLNSRTRQVVLDDATKRVAHKYGWKSSQPNWGITLGMGTLLESKEILIIANGVHKAEIVEKAIRGPKTSDVPVSLLRDHPQLIFLIDTGAASQL
jgi:glucosamine-6-phosphate deaminase